MGRIIINNLLIIIIIILSLIILLNIIFYYVYNIFLSKLKKSTGINNSLISIISRYYI